jgi:cephalosporin hydroxylase
MIDREASLKELTDDILQRPADIDGYPNLEKTESDLARYQWIIDTVKPHVVIETGLHFGGSLLWFAERVPFVISVEMSRWEIDRFLDKGVQPDNTTIIEGNSLEVVEYVLDELIKVDTEESLLRVMVVLDSDHGTDTVLGELQRYAGFVTPGSYLVCEDGIFEGWSGNWYAGSPAIALERFLEGNNEFENDLELEDRYPTTQHPGGWLKRTV